MRLPEEGKGVGCDVQVPSTGLIDTPETLPNFKWVSICNARMKGDEAFEPGGKRIAIEACTIAFIRLGLRLWVLWDAGYFERTLIVVVAVSFFLATSHRNKPMILLPS